MIKFPEQLKKAAEFILSAGSVVVACHEKPDGDAVGSMLGLSGALKEFGKDVICYCIDRPEPSLDYLPGINEISFFLENPLPANCTLVIVDCNEAHRIGPEGQRLVEQASKVVVLDHHLGEGLCLEQRLSDCCQYIDTEMSAAACICDLLLSELDINLSKNTAVCFYTALFTDTGGFRHSNTKRSTFELAGKLVDGGADPYKISRNLFQRKPAGSIELLGAVLKTLTFESGGKVGVIHSTPYMLQESGTLESDMHDFVQYPRSVEGVEIAVFVKEFQEGKVSVSLRSKSEVNVEAIAKEFGGGGHFHAAGFKVDGKALDIRRTLVDRLNREFN